MSSNMWTIGAAAVPVLGLLVLLSTGRADGVDVPTRVVVPGGAGETKPSAGSLPSRSESDAARADRRTDDAALPGEMGDWSRLAERIATDRSARFQALNHLAAGRIPHGERRNALVAWLRATDDFEVIAALEDVLRDLESKRYQAAPADEAGLLRAIESGTSAERREAVETIREELLALESVRLALRRLAAAAGDPEIARAALLALSRSPDEETTRFLAERLARGAESDPDVRAAAANAMARRRGELASATLVASLADPAEDLLVKRFAASGLAIQEPSEAVVRALVGAYQGELDFTVRFNAVASLQAHAGRADVRAELETIFATDPSDDIRALALTALVIAGGDVERFVEAARRDSSPKVREMAASLLGTRS